LTALWSDLVNDQCPAKLTQEQLAEIINASTPCTDKSYLRFWEESQTLDNFHLFPKLPKELRENIWELALPDPTTVTINCGYLDWSSDSVSIDIHILESYQRGKIPSRDDNHGFIL